MQILQTILAFGLLLLAGPAFTQTVGDVEYGLASYYSVDFQGRETSYGEKYNKNEMTAAHKRYPYNSRIRITRMDNNRAVVVRVIDQGPFIRGRVVDLSRRAAESLGLINDATAEVKVELLELPDRATAAASTPATAARSGNPPPATTPRPSSYDNNQLPPPQDRLREVEVTTSPSDDRAQEPRPQTTTTTRTTTTTTSRASSSSSSSAQAAQAPLVRKNFNEYGLYKIEIRRPENRGWGVQVASMADYESAMRQVATLQTKWFDNILISIEPGAGGKTYKVILGPFDSEASAQRYERDLARRYKISGFTVNLNDIRYQR